MAGELRMSLMNQGKTQGVKCENAFLIFSPLDFLLRFKFFK